MACKKSELRLFLSDVRGVLAEVFLPACFMLQARSHWRPTSLNCPMQAEKDVQAGAGLDSQYLPDASPKRPQWVPAVVATAVFIATARASTRFRSEERRVGKEGRSRWAPDH